MCARRSGKHKHDEKPKERFLKERESEKEFLEMKIKSSETKNILTRLRADQML